MDEALLRKKAQKLAAMKQIVVEISNVKHEKAKLMADFKEQLEELFKRLNELANEDDSQGEFAFPEGKERADIHG